MLLLLAVTVATAAVDQRSVGAAAAAVGAPVAAAAVLPARGTVGTMKTVLNGSPA